MPALEEHATSSRPPKMDLAGELVDTLQTHLKRVDSRMESFEKTTDARMASIEKTISSAVNRVLWVGVVLVVLVLSCVFGASMYMISLIAESRGVDTARAAESSTIVIEKTSESISTTTGALTGANPDAADVEALEEQPDGG